MSNELNAAKVNAVAALLATQVVKEDPSAVAAGWRVGPHSIQLDFSTARPFDQTQLATIGNGLRLALARGESMDVAELSSNEAVAVFANNAYFRELVKDRESQEASEPVTVIYSDSGPLLADVGGVYPEVAHLRGTGIRIDGSSAAFWKGSERNESLQRISVLVFASERELKAFLSDRDKAAARDHRKIGQDQKIFFNAPEVGLGLPLWLPNGTIVRDELERLAREVEHREGYERVVTPVITKGELYERSGHLPHYEDDMYPPISIEQDDYYLRPMNCPHHHMVFQELTPSYRDLPLRLAEYGSVFRKEASGQLHGLMRVRGFTQNDAHIYATADQAVDEFRKAMDLHREYYELLGINDFHMVLALRDPSSNKYHKDEAMWERAEAITREAIVTSGIPYEIEVGGAAHYGPKVDFVIRSASGKSFTISTAQLDLYMPERFGLEYVSNQNHRERPVVIHRAPLGSHERMVGFLLEHFDGRLPLWLSPQQVAILPVKAEHRGHAAGLQSQLERAGLRVKVNDSAETLGRRIRSAEMARTPYVLVIGDHEVTNNTVKVRGRGRKDLGEFGSVAVGRWLKDANDSRALEPQSPESYLSGTDKMVSPRGTSVVVSRSSARSALTTWGL